MIKLKHVSLSSWFQVRTQHDSNKKVVNFRMTMTIVASQCTTHLKETNTNTRQDSLRAHALHADKDDEKRHPLIVRTQRIEI